MSAESPYRRDNYYASSDDDQGLRGHAEVDGTDAAEYIAFQLLAEVAPVVCERHLDVEPWNGGRLAELVAWCFDGECIDGRGDQLHRENRLVELTEPALHLPKQTERSTHTIEYRQHRHRRRYNPETGYINWGESTSTGIPEVGYKRFRLSFHTYLYERLADNNLLEHNIDEYLEVANRFWHSPDLNSHQSLTKAIAHVRECEDEHAR